MSGGRARGKTKGPAKRDLSLWTPEMQALHTRALRLEPALKALDRSALLKMDHRAFLTVLCVQLLIGVGRDPRGWSASQLRQVYQLRHKTEHAVAWVEANLDYLNGEPQHVELTLRKALDG